MHLIRVYQINTQTAQPHPQSLRFKPGIHLCFWQEKGGKIIKNVEKGEEAVDNNPPMRKELNHVTVNTTDRERWGRSEREILKKTDKESKRQGQSQREAERKKNVQTAGKIKTQ